MATKSTSYSLNANTGATQVESTATITGRTVYGRSISAVETITQPAGNGASVTVGTLTLLSCDNQSIYAVSSITFNRFEIISGSGNTITSTSKSIGTLDPHENYEETEIPWSTTNVITTVCGDTLTGRLYLNANLGGNSITIDTELDAYGSICYGVYNSGLSSGNLHVFDFILPGVSSTGSINYGDININITMSGGEGGITVVCNDRLIANTGGTSHFTVTWHDMMSSGITITCTGDSGTVVIRHLPSSFSGANGSGTVNVELGQNAGSGGRFTVTATGKDFNGYNKTASDYGEQNGGYVPPSTGAQITFTTEPIYLVNLCDDDILFEKLVIRVSAAGNDYYLTYVNPDDSGDTISPNAEVPLQLDGTPPASLTQSSPISATITYIRAYTWDKHGDIYGIANDELAELTGPGVDGIDFSIDISGVSAGEIEFNQSGGIGTVSLGGEGLIFNSDYETYFTIQHNFNS